jgi:hypothetical protein
MRTAPLSFLCLGQLLASVLLCVALAGCGSEPAAPPKAALPETTAAAAAPGKSTNTLTAAKSVFHAGVDSGRDPFFPNSNRGLAKKSETAPMPMLPSVSYLKLLGIRPGTNRPLALINRTALALGEEGEVPIVVGSDSQKTEVHKVSVRCLEIRRDSVLISIAGEEGVKELRMAQRK